MNARRQRNPRRHALRATLVAAAGLVPGLGWAATAGAQVTLDGSLGPARSLTGSELDITADLGSKRGSNLLHSFGEFNLANGQTAIFSGPADVRVVMARVTGGSRSMIDGRLACSIAGADLYLMNSAGIVFGPNSKIDVSGSFVATTANVLRMADGTSFHSVPNPVEDALLTSAPPVAFGFLSPGGPAEIRIDKVNATEPLLHAAGDPPVSYTLVGGKITLSGAATVRNRGGAERRPARVDLIALASPGELTFDPSEAFSQPVGLDAFAALGAVELSDTRIEVGSAGNGEPQAGRALVRGANLTMTDSVIRTRSNRDVGGIGVDVGVRDALKMTGASGLRTSTSGDANAGPIRITAGLVQMLGANIISDVEAGATGTGGDIGVTAGEIRLSPGELAAEIAATTLGGRATDDSGRGGDVTITSTNPVGLESAADQRTRIFSLTGGFGDAGTVRVDAPGAEAFDPRGVYSAAYADGAAGDVVLNGVLQLIPAGRISFDGTAGAEAGPVPRTPEGQRGGGTYAVGADDGVLRGANLFYSFDEFSLSPQQALVFTGRAGDPATGQPVSDVRNIVARVTGGEPSVIDGTLRSEVAGATLFVLNPAGVTLGPFARLDVPGSVVLSSASAVRFAGGGSFGIGTTFAGAPDAGVPIGLDFAAGAGQVAVLGTPLTAVNPDKEVSKIAAAANGVLTLAGGSILIEGRKLAASGDLALPGNDGAGRVNLVAIAGGGSLTLDPTSATEPIVVDAGRRGPVRMNDEAIVDASGVGYAAGDPASRGGRGGAVQVYAESLEMTGGSQISSASTGGLDNAAGRGLLLDLTGDLAVRQSVIASSALGKSDGGGIIVRSANVLLEGNGGTDAPGFELGDLGVTAETTGEGRAGGIRVHTGNLTLLNGARLQSTTNGLGAGGDVVILAVDVLLDNGVSEDFTTISTQTSRPFSGDGGNIEIGLDGRLRTLELRSGASISSATLSQGSGGTITIRARDAVTLDGTMTVARGDGTLPVTVIDASSRGFTAADPDRPHGNAGRIDLRTGVLTLRDFAQLQASTQTSGAGGDITIRADVVEIAGGRLIQAAAVGDELYAAVFARAGRNTLRAGQEPEFTGKTVGNGGRVTIRAGRLSLLDGGTIQTSTANEGDAGDIEVHVSGVLLIEGLLGDQKSSLESRARNSNSGSLGTGDGGDIFVSAGRLRMLDEGRIVADSLSAGMSGGIHIAVRDTIEMADGAIISTLAETATAGGVSISAGQTLDLRDDRPDRPFDKRTRITTEATAGDAGAIRLDVPGRVSLTNSLVTTKAGTTGGDIFISSFLLSLDRAAIIADAVAADAGNIDIRAKVEGFNPDLPQDFPQESIISASSVRGISDDVFVSPPEADIVGALLQLEGVEPATEFSLQPLCGMGLSDTVSTFVPTGRGGAPMEPGAWVPYLPLSEDRR